MRLGLVVFLSSLILSASGVLIHGIPLPAVHDEFSYLFAGQTFAGLRLAYPPPPGAEAFFSPHILVEPAFAAKYPPGQGLILAVGTLLGLPIAGVWLSGALAASALLWASRALFPLPLALLPPGLFMITVLFTGPWIGTYMGGLVAFSGGALVIGHFLRWDRGIPEPGAWITLGVGLGVLALSRPFEGLVLVTILGILSPPLLSRARVSGVLLLRRGALVVVPLGAAFSFQLALNAAVTGSALRTPHAEFHRQYMEVPLFRWQPPVPPEKPDPRLHALEANVPQGGSWADHLGDTVRSAWWAARDVGGPPFPWLVLAGGMVAALSRAGLPILVVFFPILQSGATHTNFSHYFAPVAPAWFLLPAFLLLPILSHLPRRGEDQGGGIRRWIWMLRNVNPEDSSARGPRVVAGALAVVVLWTLPAWTSSHDRVRHPLSQFLDALESRAPVLAFVRYHEAVSAHIHIVYNDPTLANPVILANDLGLENNCQVLRHFPDRTVLEVMLRPTALFMDTSDLRKRCSP